MRSLTLQHACTGLAAVTLLAVALWLFAKQAWQGEPPGGLVAIVVMV
jgi:hypothetical protein